jgi:excisionase family DNA binding protein
MNKQTDTQPEKVKWPASPDTLDLFEAAAMLKIAPTTVNELASNGELPGCKVGISWVFLRDALRDYLWRQTEAQQRERRIKSGLEEQMAKGVSHETRKQRSKRRTSTADVLRAFDGLPEPRGE